jgi:hypothetical protein
MSGRPVVSLLDVGSVSPVLSSCSSGSSGTEEMSPYLLCWAKGKVAFGTRRHWVWYAACQTGTHTEGLMSLLAGRKGFLEGKRIPWPPWSRWRVGKGGVKRKAVGEWNTLWLRLVGKVKRVERKEIEGSEEV